MTQNTDDRDTRPNAQTIGRYANCFKVGFNALEVVLEFGEHYADSGAPGVHTRIVTNSFCARALLTTLDESLAAQAQQIAATSAPADDASGAPHEPR
ncbi:MAG: hypothetical protein JNN30_08725 [Rhodanobacteraceae bacterium]|nr:hypothetical protein [Rhodanobacteraceae bacterium]